MTTGDMSRILGTFTLDHLNVKLNVSTYRHLSAAIGRHLVVGIIEAEEEKTTGMDAMAGRQTTTSEAIYGLQPGEVGRINERILALFRAMAGLWHAKVLGLELEGRVATLDQILHPSTMIEDLSGRQRGEFGQTDLHTLIDHLKAIFEDSVVNKIVPHLMEALEEKMADQFLQGGTQRCTGGLTLPEVAVENVPVNEGPQPMQRNKGKQYAIVQVRYIKYGRVIHY